jgi:Zn-dependent protease
VLHELGHAVVARAQGMRINGITLFLFGGVAELGSEPPSALAEFLMAIAGPAVSAVLAAGFFLAGLVLVQSDGGTPLVPLFGSLAFINLTVLVFNLVPAFPLDGGRVLRSILWAVSRSLRRSTRWASQVGRAFAWVLMALGVYSLVVHGDVVGGLWQGLLGLFLYNAARGSYEQVLVRQALEGEPVVRFMNPEPIVVPPWLTLRNWVEDYVYRYHRKTFPVVTDGRLQGVISTQALAGRPRDTWDQHTVGELMRPDVAALSITPRADALEALGQMQATGSSRLLVTEGDRLLGLVSLKDLLRFLHLKLELEGPGDETPPGRDGPGPGPGARVGE